MQFLRFDTREVVFLSLIAVGMIVSAMLTVPLVVPLFATVPGAGAVVTAFFLGFFLALSYRKIAKPGAATFTSLLMGVVFAFITPSMFFILVSAALITDAALILKKPDFSSLKTLVLISAVFNLFVYIFGYLFGSFFNLPGFGMEMLISQWPLIVSLALLTLALGSIGGYLGAKGGREYAADGV